MALCFLKCLGGVCSMGWKNAWYFSQKLLVQQTSGRQSSTICQQFLWSGTAGNFESCSRWSVTYHLLFLFSSNCVFTSKNYLVHTHTYTPATGLLGNTNSQSESNPVKNSKSAMGFTTKSPSIHAQFQSLTTYTLSRPPPQDHIHSPE